MCDFHFAWDKGSERRERKKTHEVANRDREEEEEKKVRLVSTTNTNREGRYPGIEIKLLGTTFPLFAVLDNKKKEGERKRQRNKGLPRRGMYVGVNKKAEINSSGRHFVLVGYRIEDGKRRV